MLVASAGLLAIAHRRRVGLAWVCYCPVAILMLSLSRPRTRCGDSNSPGLSYSS